MGSLLWITLFSAIFVITESSIIYSAQCCSRCLKYKSSKDTEPFSFRQCMKPCQEKDIRKLNSCFDYCKSSKGNTAPCHYSCKFLKGLHGKGTLPGKCSTHKQYNEDTCNRNSHCSELTKCCYNYCKEISVVGEEVKPSVINLTSTSLVLTWGKSNFSNAVYIIQMRVLHSTTIYYKDYEWGRWQQKWQGSDVVPIKFISIHSGARLQFRIAVVDATGLQSIGSPTPVIRTLFNASKPSSPEDVWLLSKIYKSKKVDVTLAWLAPAVLDVPVYNYRLSWKEIPDTKTDGVMLKMKKTQRVSGTQLNYTITNLQADKTYNIKIQAVCRWKEKRLKSKKISMNVSTHYPKGTTKDEVVVRLTNISNFSHKRFNNSSNYRDVEFEEVEVIVESGSDGPKTKPRSPGEDSSDGRISGGGGKRIDLLTILIFIYIYIFAQW